MSHIHDVIVIGGGPAGCAAAIELRRQGIADVLLLEREDALGGATRHCSHSPFGMREFGRVYFGANYGKRLAAEVARAGVEVRLSHSAVRLGEDGRVWLSSPQGVSQMQARRIIVTTGTREMPRSARLVSGDRPIGVLTTGALQAYVAFHGLMPFRRPVIIGSELVSFSALLTCLSHGAKPAALLEQNERLTARAPCGMLARIAAVPLLKAAKLVDICGQGRVESVTVEHAGQRQTIPCDGVLFTGQFVPESSLLSTACLATTPLDAAPVIDQFGRLANPIYYAAGNLLRAVETGGWAFREGRSVGLSVAQDLQGQMRQTATIPVSIESPIKLVVPNAISPGGETRQFALGQFQLRMKARTRGTLKLLVDGQPAWQQTGIWLPERRILVPFPAHLPAAQKLAFVFEKGD